MDGRQFDALSRAFVSFSSRRALLRWLAGAVGIAALGRAPQSVGRAATQGGCPEGQTDCFGACADLLKDPKHCGACGNACPSGGCSGGVCLPVGCPPGQTDCGGFCSDLSNDAKHCGGCGVGCESGLCAGGACVPVGCPAGTTDCGGACVDPATDPRHCGGCGVVCPVAECADGVCVPSPEPTVPLPTEPAVAPSPGACAVAEDATTVRRRVVVRSPDDQLALDIEVTEHLSALPLDPVLAIDIVATVTAGQRVLLKSVSTSAASGTFEITVQYGDFFAGIREASAWSEDGLTAQMVIDGRRTRPFAVETDVSAVRFEDGGPQPQVTVDHPYDASLKDLDERAHAEIAACLAADAQSASGGRFLTSSAGAGHLPPASWQSRRAGPGVDPGSVMLQVRPGGFECERCMRRCAAGYAACHEGAVLSCAFAWFPYWTLVCFASLLACPTIRGGCEANCRRPRRECCPVSCENLTGLPSCCDEGERCFVPSDGRGYFGCCPTGQVVCGGVCCPPNQSCAEDRCCPNDRLQASVCCPEGMEFTDEGVCCARGVVSCGGVCCASGQEACTDEGVCCPAGAASCGGVCCPDGECVRGVCCATPCGPTDRRTCCRGTAGGPPGECCADGVCVGPAHERQCIDGRHCPSVQACGSICCEGAQVCEDPADKRCGPCPEGSTPCLVGMGCCPTTL